MCDITICVATKEECNKNCKRRHLAVNPYSQAYANFSLDYLDKNNNCKAYIGFSKKYENKKIIIN